MARSLQTCYSMQPHTPTYHISFIRSAVLWVKVVATSFTWCAGASSAEPWSGLSLQYANKSCLEESNSNLFIAHLRYLLHLIGYEERQPDWSQDCSIGTNGNCYKILIYAIFQTKGDSMGNWPLRAETLITRQQWSHFFNTKVNDKIKGACTIVVLYRNNSWRREL